MLSLAFVAFLAACNPTLRFDEVWVEEDGALVSVWGHPDGQDWVVGGQIEQGAAWVGSGTDWSALEVPEGVGLLNWVHGSDPDDVWIGGIGGALLHWDGVELTHVDLGIDEAIWGVFAASSDEVYAVGGSSAFGGESATAWRYDGSEWMPIALPPEVAETPSLFKVTAVGSDIWMVGAQGRALTGRDESWSLVSTGTAEDLVTVVADGSEAVIVGGRVTGTVFRGSVNGLDPVASTPSGLFGVSVLADGRTLVSGVRGFLATVGPEVDEFQLLDVPNEHLLHAVWTTPGEFAYAVGGNLQSSIGPYRGTLLVARAPEGTR